MDYNIVIKEQVYIDIELISDYIERTTFDIGIAHKIVSEIFGKICSLKLFPYRNRIFYKDFRVYNFKGKNIFFKIYENKKEIVIFRILGGRQDYTKIV